MLIKQPPNYFQLGLRHSLGEMERYLFDMQYCNAIKKTNIPTASDSVSHLRTLLGELERYLPLAQVAFSATLCMYWYLVLKFELGRKGKEGININLPDCRKYPNFIATGKLLNVPFKISGIDFVTDCPWKLLQNGMAGGWGGWHRLFEQVANFLSTSQSQSLSGETSNYITSTHILLHFMFMMITWWWPSDRPPIWW